MKSYPIRLTAEAETDLLNIYNYIFSQSGSQQRATHFTIRITQFMAKLETFPERGTVRSDIRPGLRIVGVNRSVTLAFEVEDQEVIVHRILYHGQSISIDK